MWDLNPRSLNLNTVDQEDFDHASDGWFKSLKSLRCYWSILFCRLFLKDRGIWIHISFTRLTTNIITRVYLNLNVFVVTQTNYPFKWRTCLNQCLLCTCYRCKSCGLFHLVLFQLVSRKKPRLCLNQSLRQCWNLGLSPTCYRCLGLSPFLGSRRLTNNLVWNNQGCWRIR